MSKKEGEDPMVLQDWASHIRYPRTLIDRHPRPTVDTGLFKNAAQLRYEQWLRFCIPLHRITVSKRCFWLRVIRVRMRAAKRLRDKWILDWVRRRVAAHREAKRLEEIARAEAERLRLEELDEQRRREEEKRRR